MILPFDRYEWPDDFIEQFEERAALMQYLGGLSQADAERLAEAVVRKDAQDSRWESLT